jgi:hypothetical protein
MYDYENLKKQLEETISLGEIFDIRVGMVSALYNALIPKHLVCDSE